MKMQMKGQDLLELYQLVGMYVQCYGDDKKKTLQELLEGIEKKYRESTRGKDIKRARNPRGAGRKKEYPDGTNQKILEMYRSRRSLREIAREVSCSVGHVQDVIREIQ